MKKEISRVHILPDISGDVYEKDGYYWQDITEKWEVVYENSKFLKKSMNPILARRAELFPTPYQVQNHVFADKWDLIVDKKYVTKYEYRTYSVHAHTAPKLSSTTQYWYGRVNYWTRDQNLLDTEIAKMKSVGLTGYIIEMAGWTGSAGDIRAAKGTAEYTAAINGIKTVYKHLHTLCENNGIWLFVCIVNDNALSSKHGNTPFPPAHYYNDIAVDLLNIVLEDGNINIIVQPISELYDGRVSNHPGPGFQTSAVSQLKAARFFTVNNDAYGRPTTFRNCDYKAYHPDSIDASLPTSYKDKTFIVSDTGSIISELNGDVDCDVVDANCSKSRVHTWRAKCSGYAVCGYYDYKRSSYNPDAIDAMAGN